MNGGRRIRPAWLGGVALLLCALGAGAMMNDDDPDGPGPPDVCVEPIVGLSGAPFLNGLPVIQQEIEVVADNVKVAVETTPRCHIVTPSSLPFVWEAFGPTGPVSLNNTNTLRVDFRPVVAGAYQARITYCPNTCQNKHVGNDIVDIPPQSASLTIFVNDRMPVPPATKPILTPTALTGPTAQQVADELAFHEERDRKCGFPGSLADISTPQLVPVRGWGGSGDYRLLEGVIRKTNIAYNDNELNHYSHDIGIHVVPDPQHDLVKMPGKTDMEIEWESNYFPGSMRPSAGDRVSAYGFHTYDCHHSPIATEIHPPVMTAVHRGRAIRIPDGWAPPGGSPLGSNIWVPGIITDVWANVRAGEISSNCSDTGLHQEATLTGIPSFPILFGACIQSPHPIRRAYSFNIYLPENPQQRAARAGLVAPPAPLHFRVEPGSGPAPIVVRDVDGDVTFLRVFIDLTGYTGETYQRRIVAGWVQPSPQNWGLEQWKFGIPSMRVFEDHDLGTDGDWVFWASLNNRDQEWTRLLNEHSVGEGTYTFGGRPWETESPHADRSLGPHLLLFNPPFSQYFPGPPGVDLTRSLEMHTSGYDAEFWDDQVGMVSTVLVPSATLPVGQRITLNQGSSTGDYKLTYFYERLGPVAGAALTAAGQALADTYTLGAEGRCTLTRRNLCLLLPDFGAVVNAWDPSQEPAPPGEVEFDWFGHAIFEPQEPEPFSLTEMPLDHLGRGLLTMLQRAPDRAQEFFTELREEFDAVRGGTLESDYARALPAFEAHLPADQWQLHFGDIDPTPVDLALTRLTMSPPGAAAGERVVFTAEITNQGSGDAAPFGVRLEIDGVALRVMSIPALAAGAGSVVEFPAWIAEPGPHQLTATADALARIREPEEQDNVVERRIVIGPAPAGLPDLSILTVDPAEAPRAGRPVAFVARVQNKGGNALASFAVRFAVDGAEIGEAIVPGLAAGEQVDVASPRPWTAQPRRHTIQAIADALAAEPESNEGNNALARAFRVRARSLRDP
jgi:hypothetical protein